MAEPSKVIHVRNVGHKIAESDLLQLLQPFGTVTKVMMLRAKNQALLQMYDVSSAAAAMQYYANVKPSVRFIFQRLETNYQPANVESILSTTNNPKLTVHHSQIYLNDWLRHLSMTKVYKK